MEKNAIKGIQSSETQLIAFSYYLIMLIFQCSLFYSFVEFSLWQIGCFCHFHSFLHFIPSRIFKHFWFIFLKLCSLHRSCFLKIPWIRRNTYVTQWWGKNATKYKLLVLVGSLNFNMIRYLAAWLIIPTIRNF